MELAESESCLTITAERLCDLTCDEGLDAYTRVYFGEFGNEVMIERRKASVSVSLDEMRTVISET